MAEGELDAEMVALAKAIITQRTGGFNPTTYRIVTRRPCEN
jgi:non-homologous end joining protein Ku